jgi:tetratricopeptide (TPR) repeat protein
MDTEYYKGSALDRQNRILQYQVALEQAERTGGAYSSDLGEILLGLGRVYQEFGEHEDAITIFKRSAHLTRINEGLNSEGHLAALEELLESYLQTGDIAHADDIRNRMFRVQRNLYPIDSNEYLDAMTEYVQWQQVAYRYKFGPRTYARLLSIEELDKEASQSHPDLTIERFYNCYLVKAYKGEPVPKMQISVNGQGGQQDRNADVDWHKFRAFGRHVYQNGVKMLEEYIDQEQDDLKRAHALALLGDWQLWNGKVATAKKLYLEAYALDNTLFEKPTQIPPEDVYADVDYIVPAVEHEVEVRFTVRSNGRLRDVTAEETEENRSARIRALKDVRRWRFRPRIENGEIVDTADVVARYKIYQD